MHLSKKNHIRDWFVFAGLSVWGLLAVSCVATSRTLVAPPQIAGASFVGSSECAMCHEDITRDFAGATHARLVATDTDGTHPVGCESCHGPGSEHAKAGGGAGTIVNPGKSSDACFQCHLDKRGEFSLPHTHPVLASGMTCTDCHDVHSGPAVKEGGTTLAGLNETCISCHTQQGGPYVFEHEASREGCVVCHLPHGSPNPRMLRTSNQNLCLQCHFQQQTAPGVILIGGRNHASFLSRGTCWSAGCHEAVHGSHVNSSLRF